MIRVKLRPLDFRTIRLSIYPVTLLTALGWTYRFRRGDYYRGGCPLHRSTHATSRCLSIKGEFWFCHKCRRGGDVIALAAELWRVPLLEAAHDLCDEFSLPKVYL